MAKKLINAKVTLQEDAILTEYAVQTERTKTDIVRELIRSLKSKLSSERKNGNEVERSAANEG